MIDAQVHHLSQVINEKEQKNFYDLINGWRIEEFLKEVKSEKNKKYTLLAIAYDCGFNSKASFNRNFKKYTGKTPTEYLNKYI
nr:helix-turn-helix domain-containing protein [Rhabdobacter roseus]